MPKFLRTLISPRLIVAQVVIDAIRDRSGPIDPAPVVHSAVTAHKVTGGESKTAQATDATHPARATTPEGFQTTETASL